MVNNKYIGIVDEPNPKGSEDTLDIYRHADALTSFIKNTSTPMTIGVQGEWGSGKTSLLNSIFHSLDKEGGKYLQIWINSWEHSLLTSPEQALLKIINAIINEMVLGDDNTARQNNIKKTTGNLIKGALRLGAAVVGGSKGSEVAEEMLGNNINSIKELREQLITLANEIQNRNTNAAEKIIIYVDDLDRIEPKDAVLVLELLKNIFSIPNCVFVLAIDYQVVVKGLEHKFGRRTDENEWEFRAFFDKIIQLPFMMPMGQYNKGKYVSNLLYQIGFIDKKEKFVDQIDKVLNFTIGGNPRSLKRLVNSLALINIFAAIDEQSSLKSEQTYGVSEDVKDMVLFSLVCLQISYPAIYEILVANPAFPNWNADTAFEVTKKAEENDLDTFERDFAIVNGKEDFDEDWEKSLFRICYVRPRYRSRVGDISKFFSYIKDEILIDKQNDIPFIIGKILSDTAVTNVNTSEDQQRQTVQPFKRTMYSGFDEWKKTQVESMPKGPKGFTLASICLEIQELLHTECSSYFKNKEGFEWKYSKTGGCTGYADNKKFLAITSKGSMGAAINILKDFERDYRLPRIRGFKTTHIRPFNPNNPESLIAFPEQFRITAPTNEENPLKLFKDNLNVLLSLISRSYDLATIHRDKILKELKKDSASHKEISQQKEYLNPDYQYEYHSQ